ncbi:hypothetical protein SAMD00019534_027110 [Acytostelium subglobosum LB1]|uniref:hypothetical protein n=1 Tax=Acytostelium subglobosum LB1 TaxID=1410327 RepID=UPI000644C2B2|nr:hypothetical protein SAMD00019534_027110 [Acytostelium subglobosum LB1]GAM19536.1 hypothetical protein SAMD00019534_027110 [Acytostelium subglobosum LB1]|eukprot:XP_012757463.1 hypothetical protein SAMD00019534_027110 [Acytostelium subglobosum LB1]
MLRSARLFQNIPSSTLSPLYGGYMPRSAMVPVTVRTAGNAGVPGSRMASSAAAPATGKIPDPQGAIQQSKIYHYSSIGLVALLPVSLLLPTSEITLITDCALGLIIPAHFYIGMNSVINDYVYSKVPLFLSKALIIGCSGVILAGIVLIAKKTGLGAAVRTLWVK